jgi:serine protease
MKNWLFIGVAGLLVSSSAALAGGPSVDEADEALQMQNPTFSLEQVLVRFQPGTTLEQVKDAMAKAGATAIVWTYELVPDLYCFRVAAGAPQQAIAQLRAMPEVQYAELDYIRHAMVQTTPYGITMVQAPNVWTSAPGTRGGGVRVAVLDTGVDLAHPDLPVPVLTQSFIAGQAVDDLHSHGTHTSGTVLAIDNTIGVVGVAPSAQLMIGKVLSNGGSGSDAGVLAGINWAVTNGAKVVSMSLGGGGSSQAGQDTMTAAVNAGVVVMASAGNANNDIPSYPASYTGCMSIAAVDADSARAGFSSFGQYVSCTAPGVSVQSTVPIISATATWSGTPRSGSIMTGSGLGTATGTAYYCGVGSVASDFPAAVAGNIAHIRRGPDANGPVTFQTKVQNALDAGAVGVVISNNVAGGFSGTLNMNVSIPVVGISQADGDTLQGASPISTTVFTGQTGHGYANFSGTSMSCPHVAGVAALLISNVAPQVPTVAQVRTAIEQTATDLGDTGWDQYFGWGLVNAQSALARLRSDLSSGCGTSDFNGDGDFGTDQDIEAFFACLAGNCCPTCLTNGADFNRDGDVGTDQDIEAFFRVLAGGNC